MSRNLERFWRQKGGIVRYRIWPFRKLFGHILGTVHSATVMLVPCIVIAVFTIIRTHVERSHEDALVFQICAEKQARLSP